MTKNESDIPTSGAWSGGVHRLAVRVYYEDTDFTGVVYYANYLKFLERGRSDALRSAGVRHDDLLQLETPLGFVVRKITAEYLKPARIDDALIIETRFTAAKAARLSVEQSVLRGDEILLTASVDAACIDLSGRPRRLPKPAAEAIARASVWS
ncbi:tol-pal system-associated acyl-CoA thioesterase [Maricaulaceae bacterium MS644]